MKRFLFTFATLVFFTSTYAQENLKIIKGKITYLESPVANADVKVSGSEAILKSNTDGSYEVQAYQGDIITFSYPSLRDMEIVVEDVTRILNISMSPDITELDEVVVEASKRRSQKDLQEDYAINKNIIRTAFGYLDGDRAAGQVRIIDEDEINSVNMNVSNLLTNRFSSISSGPGGWMNIRGSSSISNNQLAIFDIDGQIFTPVVEPSGKISGLPTIDVGNIKRIAVLNNLANTVSYGSVGNGGVIVINTFGGTILDDKMLDRARLRNNIFKDDALSQNDLSKNEPTYLLDYKASTTAEAAKSVYENNFKKYFNSPHFFIDSYAYLLDKGEEKFATEILEKNLLLVDKNAVYLKALGYYAEANGDLDMAKDLYEQVFILRPNYSQSYRDLAESYRDVGKFKKAAAMYARYNYLVEEGFMERDTAGLGKIMHTDSKNLLALEGQNVLKDNTSNFEKINFDYYEDTRLVFEWNDSEAEFELQFVNPEKHYHTWKHTSLANAARVMDGKLKGYSSQELWIDRSLVGKWQVNVNYKGNKKLEPTYLKVTTYFNYGTNAQRKEVNVYRLSLKDTNHKLFDLVNSGRISTN